MPGPGGGGSRGGGFGGGSFGGGSRGGGFGGGSFGGNFGGHHNGGSFDGHHHGHHHHGPVFYGRGWRGYGYGGGFGGGCFTVVVIGLFVLFGLIWLFGEPAQVTVNGEPVYIGQSGVDYDEGTMQDYANDKYEQYFGSASAYEDNILLVFLSNEAADGYYTIAWVGDNIDYSINEMFGEYGEYGAALRSHITTDYFAYSLDTDFARVIDEMTKSIVSLGFESSFVSESDKSKVPASKFVNLTDFELTADVVDKALADFTAKTGIPCVVVVDYAERVFGGNESAGEIIKGDVSAQDSSKVNVTESKNEKLVAVSELSVSTVAIAVLGIMAVIGLTVAVTIRVTKKKDTAEKQNSPKNDMPWEL